MGPVDIQRMIRSRVAMLTNANPDLSIEDDLIDGVWGLLTLRERGHLVGFEFLETEESWRRPDAVIQYFEASDDGYYVGVVVPEDDYDEITERVYTMGELPVMILTYEGLGVAPMQLG
ncbi:MAG: hypothetical protein SA339_06375 [Methanomassiliicoccus sp.]|nr:hypothetical protein [Methanomassiliicoccus sp.]